MPVSNAHMPYIKGIYIGKPKIGKSYIEFEDINWKNGEDLVEKLKEVIKNGSYEQHRKSVPTWFLKFTMALRKLPRTIGISWLDYEWSGKSPVVGV